MFQLHYAKKPQVYPLRYMQDFSRLGESKSNARLAVAVGRVLPWFLKIHKVQELCARCRVGALRRVNVRRACKQERKRVWL